MQGWTLIIVKQGKLSEQKFALWFFPKKISFYKINWVPKLPTTTGNFIFKKIGTLRAKDTAVAVLLC